MATRRWKWHHAVLAVILVVSAVLNVWGLEREGYSNEYYAAAVKSMLMSWHNFFFNSFDPNGFITIDKPPVGFWIQAFFAWLFGFHGWALILPQAFAGVASVAVLYHLVRRIFGVPAGLIAAAVMALTPIAVAVARTNQVDSTLVLCMLLTAWATWKAVETRRWRWLVTAAVLEGIGFNIKMMEAYLILPALYVLLLTVQRVSWRRRIGMAAVFTAIMAAVSFSWPMAVDLTPASERPWAGSTETNSEMELIFGYNGIQRLTGDMSVGGALSKGGASAGTNGRRTAACRAVRVLTVPRRAAVDPEVRVASAGCSVPERRDRCGCSGRRSAARSAGCCRWLCSRRSRSSAGSGCADPWTGGRRRRCSGWHGCCRWSSSSASRGFSTSTTWSRWRLASRRWWARARCAAGRTGRRTARAGAGSCRQPVCST
ncbi:MAG: glycosyltransferase family 39 protein [Thermoflavifilum sp.]|nr:glycosyltransferase family 39 protein [Thermoflavifilum sp.]MCL6514648.1 glycosyltransferase family 39 protein [Alicyclobacillus sp.]